MSTLPPEEPTWSTRLTLHVVPEVGDDAGTSAVLISRRRDVKVRTARQAQGCSLSFTLPWNHTLGPSMTVGTRLRVKYDGYDLRPICDFRVISRRRSLTAKGNERGRRWSISCVGIDADGSTKIRVYPPGGVHPLTTGEFAGQMNVGSQPFSSTRTFGWMDPAADISTWEPMVELAPAAYPLFKSGAPFGWIDMSAYWIWDRAIAEDYSHPLGDIYGSLPPFTTTDDVTEAVVDHAGDDAYQVWVDDVLLEDRADTPADPFKSWARLARTRIKLSAGTHIVRFRATNRSPFPGPDDVGAFVCSVMNEADASVLTNTDHNTIGLGYVTVGMTIGEIILATIDEHTARNDDVPAVVPSFTATEDSSGQPFPLLTEWPVAIGETNLVGLLATFSDAYIAFQFTSSEDAGVDVGLDVWMLPGFVLPGPTSALPIGDRYDGGAVLIGARADGGNAEDVTYVEGG